MRKFALFQYLIVSVAVSAVVAQLIINTYYEVNAPEAAQKALLEDKIKEFYISKAYLDRKASDEKRIALLERDANVRLERNEVSVGSGGRLVTNTRAQTDSIGAITNATNAWVMSELAEIKAKYGKINSMSKWGGIGLIYVFEFLTVMLGFMAARVWVNKQIEPNELRVFITLVVVSLSFYSQWTSCQITERGLKLLLNDSGMASAYSLAFVIIVPCYFWLGSLDLELYRPESQVITVPKPEIAENSSKAKIETERDEETLTLSRSQTRMKAELPISQIVQKFEEPKPDSWEIACILIKQGRLNWSERDVVRNFPSISRYRVRERLKTLPPLSKDMTPSSSTSG